MKSNNINKYSLSHCPEKGQWQRQSYRIMKLFALLFIVHCSLFIVHCYPQAAINKTGSPPDNSAIVDVSGSATGVLINRMTTPQRNNIIGADGIAGHAPAQGLMIFNTTTNCFEAYVNDGWYSVSCPAPCTPPEAPVATDAFNFNCTSFTAHWNASIGATSYFLDVSTVNTFASFVTGYNNINVGYGTSFSVTGLNTNRTYYYRVRAATACSSGNSNIITAATTSVCYTCPASFTDSRDSKTYSAVLIGTQCWMKENLNYGTYMDRQSAAQTLGNKYCMGLNGNNDASCPMGGLYEWTNAMNSSSACNGTGAGQPACSSPVQGLCPAGWHIPSHYEFTLLERNVGSTPGAFPYDESTVSTLGTNEGDNLKVTGTNYWSNGTGTNFSGFSALPAGYTVSWAFSGASVADWWSSTVSSGGAWYRYLDVNMAWGVYRQRDHGTSGFGCSIRCIKN
jgi:uncharacterized protein (TIGR02145 family)